MNYLYATLCCILSGFSMHAQPHWKTIPSGTTTDLLSLSFPNPEIGYISGKDSLLLKTTDGGASWQTVNHSGMIFGTGYPDIVDVQFPDAMTGYAIVSNYSSPQYSGKLYETQDGGINWIPANDTINIAARKSYFFQEDNGFLIGSAFFAGRVIAGMKNGLWVNYTSFNAGAESFLYGIDFFDTLYGIIGGDDGNFYRTLDGGATWDTIYSGQDSTIYGIHFLNAATIVAAIGDGGQSIHISRDSGMNWEVVAGSITFAYPQMESITSCKRDSIIAVGYATQTSPYPGYVNWIENGFWRQQSFASALHAVTTQRDSVAFAVGDSGLIITNWDGPPSGIGATKLPENMLEVYPNPTRSAIHLRYKGPEVHSIQLTDISGRPIKIYSPASKVLNTSGLASGVYLLQISTRQGAMHRKVVVE